MTRYIVALPYIYITYTCKINTWIFPLQLYCACLNRSGATERYWAKTGIITFRQIFLDYRCSFLHVFWNLSPLILLSSFCLLEHVSRKQRASSLHLLFHVACAVSLQNTLLTRMLSSFLFSPFSAHYSGSNETSIWPSRKPEELLPSWGTDISPWQWGGKADYPKNPPLQADLALQRVPGVQAPSENSTTEDVSLLKWTVRKE